MYDRFLSYAGSIFIGFADPDTINGGTTESLKTEKILRFKQFSVLPGRFLSAEPQKILVIDRFIYLRFLLYSFAFNLLTESIVKEI